MFKNSDNNTNLIRLTVTAEPALLDRVHQHRRQLAEQTGLRVSTSGAISALIKAGLEAQHTAEHR